MHLLLVDLAYFHGLAVFEVFPSRGKSLVISLLGSEVGFEVGLEVLGIEIC